jgi:hypothetical protein
VHETSPRRVAWAVVDEVLKAHYPLCEPYLFKLKDGTELRVDFVDEGLLKRRLEERGTRFQEVWGSTGEAYPPG